MEKKLKRVLEFVMCCVKKEKVKDINRNWRIRCEG